MADLRLHLYLLHSPAALRPSVRLFSSCCAHGTLTSLTSTLRQQPSCSLGASPPSQDHPVGATYPRLCLPAAFWLPAPLTCARPPCACPQGSPFELTAMLIDSQAGALPQSISTPRKESGSLCPYVACVATRTEVSR